MSRRDTMGLFSIGFVVFTLVSACTQSKSIATPVAEQLTCGDSTMPLAVYARAQTTTEPDSQAGIAVTIMDSVGRPVQVADVQVWGPRGAVGGARSQAGTITYKQRDSGLHSVRIRLHAESPRWIYAATLRAGFLDTVRVTVGVPCTVIYRGGT